MAALMLEEVPDGGRTGALPRATLPRVLRYLRPQRRGLAVLIAVIVIDAALAVALPFVLLRIIDDGVLGGDLGRVGRLALLALLVVLLSGVTQITVQGLSSRLGQALVFRLRRDAFGHAQQLPISFYTGHRSGALVSRLNNDTDRAQEAITHQLRTLVTSLARLAFVVAAIAYLSWPVLLAVVLVPVLVLPPARGVGRRLHAVSHRWLRSFADLTSFVTERLNVSGSLLTQLYGDLARDRQAFAEVNARNRDLGVRRAMIAAAFGVSVSTASSVAVVAVYVVGGYLVVAGEMTLGTLVALAALVVRLFGPLQALSSSQVEIMTAFGQLRTGVRATRPAARRPGPAQRATAEEPGGHAGIRPGAVQLPAATRAGWRDGGTAGRSGGAGAAGGQLPGRAWPASRRGGRLGRRQEHDRGAGGPAARGRRGRRAARR
jgi:ATP-binding cassette subfamily B protein